MRTSPGLGFAGRCRCCDSPPVWTPMRWRSGGSTPWGSSIRASRAAPRSRVSWRTAIVPDRGHAIPEGFHSIRAAPRTYPRPSACGAGCGTPLSWTEIGAGSNSEVRAVVADPAAWGDVILARRDVPTSYHLSVVIDDAHQGVTHVVRGQDLFHATSLHRLLQDLLGLPQPVYHHHRLICDAEGRKLSKATRATGLRELRAAGATPADIRQAVGLPHSGPSAD